MCFLLFILLSACSVSTRGYLQQVGVTEKWFLGVTLAAFSAANMVASPLFGLYVDQRPVRFALLAAILVMVVSCALYLVASDGYVVLEARLTAGLAAGAGTAVLVYVTRVSTPENLTRKMAVVMAARQIGMIFGPVLNLPLEHVNFVIGHVQVNNYNAAALVMMVLWALCFVGVYWMDEPLVIKKASDEESDDEEEEQKVIEANTSGDDDLGLSVNGSDKQVLLRVTVPKPKRSKLSRFRVFTSFPVLVLFGAQFLLFVVQSGLETLVTPLTEKLFGWGQANNSYMFLGMAIEAVLVFVLTHRLSKRWDDRVLILIGIVVELVALALFLVLFGLSGSRSVWQFLVICGLIIFGWLAHLRSAFCR